VGAVLAGVAAGASSLHLNADRSASGRGSSGPAAFEDPGTIRKFSSRPEAARWLAEAIEDLRRTHSSRLAGWTPVRLTLPEPEEDPEAREFLRELKLALAERGVPFSTQREAGPAGEAWAGPWALRVGAARAGGQRMVLGEVSTPAGSREWSAEYP